MSEILTREEVEVALRALMETICRTALAALDRAEAAATAATLKVREVLDEWGAMATDWDRYWAAAGVLDGDISVDDAIAQWQALEALAEAADCEADQLAELVHSLEEQRASVIEQRDEAQAKAKAAEYQRDNLLARIFRDGGQKQDTYPTREAACEAADVLVADCIVQRDEARAEAARLKDQVAALVMLLQAAMPVEGEHLNCNSPAIKNIEADFWDTHRRLWRMIENDLTAVAAAWRQQVRREAMEKVCNDADLNLTCRQVDIVRDLADTLDRFEKDTLAGAGEEEPHGQVV